MPHLLLYVIPIFFLKTFCFNFGQYDTRGVLRVSLIASEIYHKRERYVNQEMLKVNIL
ncbi:hypothetical protein GcC1_c15775o26 [Golovinomyces cichoracearum]|uniref:Uncharacterized protein n=1 Tax=Golovinomyces cichoracearum TaxID=62708 RepID=A0A420IY52_9PEZI|nr:hypothetical protein GcC1_c15775o26 [Golovinomyces cichoracearum]